MAEINLIIAMIGSIISLVCLILFLSSKKYISKSLYFSVILILAVFSVIMQIDNTIIITMSIIPISIINIAIRKLSNSPISLLILSISTLPLGMSLSQEIVTIDISGIYLHIISIGTIICTLFIGINSFAVIKKFDRNITKTRDIIYFHYMNFYTIIPIIAILLTEMISVFAIVSSLVLASPILYFYRRQKKDE